MRTRPQPSYLAWGLLLLGLAGCSDNDRDPQDPQAQAGNTFAVTSANRLVTFNRGATLISTAVAITGLQSNETILGIDVRPGGTPAGELYALGSTGRLYTINVTTGTATMKSMLSRDMTDMDDPFAALNGTDFGVDFNPVPDRLRVVSNTGQNLRINVDTGATITDTALTFGGSGRVGVTSTAYTNSFASACRTALYYIDTTADRVFASADPNSGVLIDVGPLGINAEAAGGFEIVTGSDASNTGIAVLNVGGTTSTYSINLMTGAATAPMTLAGLNGGESLRGIASPPPSTAPTQGVGELLGVSETNRLVSFNSAAPQKLCTSATISGLTTGDNIVGMDVRPANGMLYALANSGRLYTINSATAAATVGQTVSAALDGTAFGVDFNPVPDRLRIVSNTGQNLRVNVDNGAATVDGAINPAGSMVTGAAYTNSVAGAGTTTLYVLDTQNDRLLIQDPPNNGTLVAVGPLGMIGDVQGVSGFEINGRTNAAFAAVTIGSATTSELHSINLTSGAATRINAIGGTERIRGLTYTARVQAAGFGVTTDNRLISFQVPTPGTLDSNAPISGLQGGENVIGMDFRPVNGVLYALTDAGRLYTINPATAAATLGQAFVADMADMTSPFTALSGTAFGVDFNPVVDRLRTVSDTLQNLRTNVDTGATMTDGTLNRGPFQATAAAYTNNFDAPASTTLYVIDTQGDRLFIQNPPNNGVLNVIGALGVDVQAVSTFEIVGPDTALAVFATATTPSVLYNINLATGAAMLVGAIPLAQPTDRITSLTAPPSMTTPAATSTVFAVINGTSLTSFARNAPGMLSAPVHITGLAMGETLIGADFRPKTGALWALGSLGNLYHINPMTGVSIMVGPLMMDPTDTTDPFMALSGTSFGVDFNPVADRLRVVSDTGQNLRINVDTGITMTDGALTGAAPAIGAAYRRNLAGTTALYVIDVATGTLSLQDPPNDGTLSLIGRLDPMQTFTATGGFDITGGDDGVVLAVLQPTGAAQSMLYRIDLGTGAATTLGAVGPSGTPLVRGLSLRVQ